MSKAKDAKPVVLIGIDDTDNLEPDSVGTGRVARQIAGALVRRGLGTSLGVTRHQLLIDPAIPYTSHNSALCIALETGATVRELAAAAGEELVARAAAGSDPGLCVFPAGRDGAATATVEAFGAAAAERVLTKAQAYELAGRAGAHLSEHGGTGDGVIGALAAVGQRARGESGRFVEAPGAVELEDREVITVGELLERTAIAAVEQWDTTPLPASAEIIPGGRLRPSLRRGVAVLPVEPAPAAPGRWVPVAPRHAKDGHGNKNKKGKNKAGSGVAPAGRQPSPASHPASGSQDRHLPDGSRQPDGTGSDRGGQVPA